MRLVHPRAESHTSPSRTLIAATAFALIATLMVPAAADDTDDERSSDEIADELDEASDERDDVESELADVRAEIQDAEAELAQVSARLSDARARLSQAEGQVSLAEMAVADAEEEQQNTEQEREEADTALARTERELAVEEEVFGDHVVHAYKYGTSGSQRGAMTFELIRQAADPNEFAVGLKQMETVVTEQDDTVRRVLELRADQQQQAEYAALAAENATQAAADANAALTMLEELRTTTANVAEEVAQDEAAQETLLASLRMDEEETDALFTRIAGRQAELESELVEQRAAEEEERRREEEARRQAEEEAQREAEEEAQREAEEEARRQEEAEEAAAREEEQRQASEAAAASEPEPEPEPEPDPEPEPEPEPDEDDSSSDEGAGGGPSVPGLVCPVEGAVAYQDFSNDWGYPRSGGRTHEGNDIFASRGTPVVAVDDAVITSWNPPSSPTRLGGITVTYRIGDGSEWYNAHLDSVADGISPGTSVAKGEPIGTVGNTGNAISTPPHLHLGRRVDGGWVNPWPSINGVCR